MAFPHPPDGGGPGLVPAVSIGDSRRWWDGLRSGLAEVCRCGHAAGKHGGEVSSCMVGLEPGGLPLPGHTPCDCKKFRRPMVKLSGYPRTW